MRHRLTLIIFFLLITESLIYSQDIKIGFVGNSFLNVDVTRTEYGILYNGNIDKNTLHIRDEQVSNFNTLGVIFKIKFSFPISTGLKLLYGKKIVDNYEGLTNYFKKTVELMSLEIPIHYYFEVNNFLYFEPGLNIGILRGKYLEQYNLYDSNARKTLDHNDEYVKYYGSIIPTIIIGTKIIGNIESSFIIQYFLTSKLKFDNLRWANVESMQYNFNGFNLGLALNYNM